MAKREELLERRLAQASPFKRQAFLALEDVRAALEAEARESLRDEAYETQLAQWVEEAGVTYHREALENNA